MSPPARPPRRQLELPFATYSMDDPEPVFAELPLPPRALQKVEKTSLPPSSPPSPPSSATRTDALSARGFLSELRGVKTFERLRVVAAAYWILANEDLMSSYERAKCANAFWARARKIGVTEAQEAELEAAGLAPAEYP